MSHFARSHGVPTFPPPPPPPLSPVSPPASPVSPPMPPRVCPCETYQVSGAAGLAPAAMGSFHRLGQHPTIRSSQFRPFDVFSNPETGAFLFYWAPSLDWHIGWRACSYDDTSCGGLIARASRDANIGCPSASATVQWSIYTARVGWTPAPNLVIACPTPPFTPPAPPPLSPRPRPLPAPPAYPPRPPPPTRLVPVVFREDSPYANRAGGSANAAPVLLATLLGLLLFCAAVYMTCCRSKPDDSGAGAPVGLPVATGVAIPISHISVGDVRVGTPVTGIALGPVPVVQLSLGRVPSAGASSRLAPGPAARAAEVANHAAAAPGGDELARAPQAVGRGPVSGVRVVGGVVGGREPREVSQADQPAGARAVATETVVRPCV